MEINKNHIAQNVVLKMLIILIYSFFILIPQYIKYFLINKTLERGMNLYHDMSLTGWEISI